MIVVAIVGILALGPCRTHVTETAQIYEGKKFGSPGYEDAYLTLQPLFNICGFDQTHGSDKMQVIVSESGVITARLRHIKELGSNNSVSIVPYTINKDGTYGVVVSRFTPTMRKVHGWLCISHNAIAKKHLPSSCHAMPHFSGSLGMDSFWESYNKNPSMIDGK